MQCLQISFSYSKLNEKEKEYFIALSKIVRVTNIISEYLTNRCTIITDCPRAIRNYCITYSRRYIFSAQRTAGNCS